MIHKRYFIHFRAIILFCIMILFADLLMNTFANSIYVPIGISIISAILLHIGFVKTLANYHPLIGLYTIIIASFVGFFIHNFNVVGDNTIYYWIIIFATIKIVYFILIEIYINLWPKPKLQTKGMRDKK